MEARDYSCEERIDAMLRKRVGDFEKALKHEDIDFIDWLNEYVHYYGDDSYYQAKRLELSGGGPGDYFLFFDDGDIEYHFWDWYDGARRVLSGRNYEVMKEVREILRELES